MRLVSWPMYPAGPAALAFFWLRLRTILIDLGIDGVPEHLTEPEDLLSHWRDPSLLLSQSCGYPFATSLAGAVRHVATPRFVAPGCQGGSYSSALVVRRDEDASSIADMIGRRVAFNSRDSQSGYNCLRALVAPLARNGRFFSQALETGAHRRSIEAVSSGKADVAAIDAVTLALVVDHAPEATAGLRVLGYTPPTAGLPLITAGATSDKELRLLRQAVSIACRGDRPATREMRLDGVEFLPGAAYAGLLASRDQAHALGYPELA